MCYDVEHKINIATMPRYFGIVLRFRYHSGPHFLINTTQIFSRRRVHVQYKVKGRVDTCMGVGFSSYIKI